MNERRVTGGGTVAVYTDISEHKRHEAELEVARDRAMAATQAKSRFLANMSHELRTPLNAIIGLTEMLREDAEGPQVPELLEPLERIHRAGQHLLQLINDILDLAKIEAGKLELHIETFDLAGPCAGHRGDRSRSPTRTAIGSSCDCAEDLGRMRADQTRLRQILLNLLSNACKFTEHGTVTLTAAREGQRRAGLVDVQRGRHRHRHDAGAARPAVPGVHAGGRVDHPQVRRHGPRARHQPQAARLMGGDIAVESAPRQGLDASRSGSLRTPGAAAVRRRPGPPRRPAEACPRRPRPGARRSTTRRPCATSCAGSSPARASRS